MTKMKTKVRKIIDKGWIAEMAKLKKSVPLWDGYLYVKGKKIPYSFAAGKKEERKEKERQEKKERKSNILVSLLPAREKTSGKEYYLSRLNQAVKVSKEKKKKKNNPTADTSAVKKEVSSLLTEIKSAYTGGKKDKGAGLRASLRKLIRTSLIQLKKLIAEGDTSVISFFKALVNTKAADAYGVSFVMASNERQKWLGDIKSADKNKESSLAVYKMASEEDKSKIAENLAIFKSQILGRHRIDGEKFNFYLGLLKASKGKTDNKNIITGSSAETYLKQQEENKKRKNARYQAMIAERNAKRMELKKMKGLAASAAFELKKAEAALKVTKAANPAFDENAKKRLEGAHELYSLRCQQFKKAVAQMVVAANIIGYSHISVDHLRSDVADMIYDAAPALIVRPLNYGYRSGATLMREAKNSVWKPFQNLLSSLLSLGTKKEK